MMKYIEIEKNGETIVLHHGYYIIISAPSVNRKTSSCIKKN